MKVKFLRPQSMGNQYAEKGAVMEVGEAQAKILLSNGSAEEVKDAKKAEAPKAETPKAETTKPVEVDTSKGKR